MALRSSMGTGRYAASESDVFCAPLAGWLGGLRGVLYFHGLGGSSWTSRDYLATGEHHLVDAIAQVLPVLSIDAGGTSAWGNATAVARVGDAVTYMQGTRGAKSGTVLLVGASMGALTALNYAKANPSKVAAVVGVIPALDLNDIVTNNRSGNAASVNAAYGGAYSEATNGPTSNPANYAASMSVPTRLFYASDDTTAIPAAVTTYAATAANVTASTVGALGHTQAAIDAVPRDQVISFLSQYA